MGAPRTLFGMLSSMLGYVFSVIGALKWVVGGWGMGMFKFSELVSCKQIVRHCNTNKTRYEEICNGDSGANMTIDLQNYFT